eukprot:jgi/Mesvir1/24638/Mv21947-RA.1
MTSPMPPDDGGTLPAARARLRPRICAVVISVLASVLMLAAVGALYTLWLALETPPPPSLEHRANLPSAVAMPRHPPNQPARGDSGRSHGPADAAKNSHGQAVAARQDHASDQPPSSSAIRQQGPLVRAPLQSAVQRVPHLREFLHLRPRGNHSAPSRHGGLGTSPSPAPSSHARGSLAPALPTTPRAPFSAHNAHPGHPPPDHNASIAWGGDPTGVRGYQKYAAVSSCINGCPPAMGGYGPIAPPRTHRATVVVVQCEWPIMSLVSGLSCSNVDLVVYVKCGRPPEVPPHLAGCTSWNDRERSPAGRVALSYLQYLAEHYEHLNDVTFFLKDRLRHGGFGELLPDLVNSSLRHETGFYCFSNRVQEIVADGGRKDKYRQSAFGRAVYDALFCRAGRGKQARPRQWRAGLHSKFALGRRRAWMWPRCKYAAMADLIKTSYAKKAIDLRMSGLLLESAWGEFWHCRPGRAMHENFVCLGDETVARQQTLDGLPSRG